MPQAGPCEQNTSPAPGQERGQIERKSVREADMMRRLLTPTAILIALLMVLPFPAQGQAGSPWFNPAWAYRNPTTINNPGGVSLSNFQAHVLLDSSFDFTKPKSDGSDIRFTASDGITLIPFWIESWNATQASASLWVQVPSIPSSGTTVYLYYGNPAATVTSSGNATFDFFDDFQSNTPPAQGYFQLGSPQTALVPSQPWETSSPHTLSVLPVNSRGYTYWGYYGLQGGCADGLAFSNDLVTWTKYTGNPLSTNARWPSVIQVGGTFYMLYEKDYCTAASQIILATSTDGIQFTDVKTIVPPNYLNNPRNQNVNLFFNPNNGQYYISWYSGNDSNVFSIMSRSASSPAGLDSTSSEVTVLSSSVVLAAPNMMYYNGTYFLSTEGKDSAGQWMVQVYSSTSPTSGFTLLPGNPVLDNNGSACMFQHTFGTTLHNYYCKDNPWTVEHRAADLTAGRLQFAPIDNTKWTASGGSWALVSDTRPNGSTGLVAQGNTSARQILFSKYTGTDYVIEAYGKQLQGRNWALGARVNDPNNFYSFNLYDDLNPNPNLWAYSWVNNNAFTLGSAAVGPVNASTWYKLTVKVQASQIDVYKDGVQQIHTSDATFPSGGVALYGENGTVANFSNVMVRKYAAIEPTATLGSVQVPQVSLSSLTLNPVSVTGGTFSTGTVTLSAPAPSSGAVVSLSSSNPSVATVPANVTVPAGATSATFPVTTSAVATSTLVTISASYGGGTSQTASLTVIPPIASLLSLSRTSVTGGTSSTGTVTLSGPAPSGGAVVSLASSNPAVASVPASGSVTVPAGATRATFPVNTSLVLFSTSVTISASYNNTTQSATLTVNPVL